jgi:DNA-binding transcriptional regulator YiaG
MTTIEARRKLGLSIAEMAQLMNVHRETWAKWENGTRAPNEAAQTLMRVFVWMHERGCLEDYRASP